MMDNSFLALLFRMKHINRWGLMYNTRPENLSEHSFECALLAHFLAAIGNACFGKSFDGDKLAAHALFHDASEVLTGDLPAPVKYFGAEITKAYKDLEGAAGEKLLGYLPPGLREMYSGYFSGAGLSGEEKTLIKNADKLCAHIKCIQELNAGNKEFRAAYNSTRAGVDAMTADEAVYFRENCLGAFALSLDEIKGTLE